MAEILVTRQVRAWANELPPRSADRLARAVDQLALDGPGLGGELVKPIRSARTHNMKELRLGGSLRVLFAFDARQRAVLLVGGDKAGRWNRWYGPAVRDADRAFERHRRNSGEVMQWQTRARAAGPKSGERSR